MTESADWVYFASQLAGSYVLGWCTGFLIKIFNQAMEKI